MPSKREKILMPSNLETVDAALYEWINEELGIHATTNEGWKKVPTIWASAERAFQSKRNKDERDDDGTLVMPIITIERTGMVKDLANKGVLGVNIFANRDYRGGTLQISRRIQQEKTSNFSNADSKRKTGAHSTTSDPSVGHGQENFRRRGEEQTAVYEILSIPYPVYLNITYSINLRSEYQQQMNEMVSPFMSRLGGINSFMLRKDGHKYEVFIQPDFSIENNVSSLNADERTYQTKVEMKVLGYIIGEGKNQITPKVVIRETQARFKLARERTILEDEVEQISNKSSKERFYRG